MKKLPPELEELFGMFKKLHPEVDVHVLEAEDVGNGLQAVASREDTKKMRDAGYSTEAICLTNSYLKLLVWFNSKAMDEFPHLIVHHKHLPAAELIVQMNEFCLNMLMSCVSIQEKTGVVLIPGLGIKDITTARLNLEVSKQKLDELRQELAARQTQSERTNNEE